MFEIICLSVVIGGIYGAVLLVRDVGKMIIKLIRQK